MHYVYGPVPSRRLGQSLGVDPIPLKTCNYNCVYCQLGRTTPITNERRDYFPAEDILAEVQAALKGHAPGEIDYITFVGQGEPLLCASLGWLIRQVKALTDIPIALITNGSLLFRVDVRREIRPADVVMPTLDAADPQTFRRINRPWPRLNVTTIVDGLAAFRDTFDGQLWVETMLIKGLNDDPATLERIAEALNRIQPDRVQLNLPVRPPAEDWVAMPDDRAVERAIAILGSAAEIISPYEGSFDLSGFDEPTEAVLAIIRRHPMREQRLLETLNRFIPGEVEETLNLLQATGRARRHVYRNQVFWEYAEEPRQKGVQS